MYYILGFLWAAAIPFALAAYGVHLAANVLDTKRRNRSVRFVWALAALGVIFAGIQQWYAYELDKESKAKQARAEEDQRNQKDQLEKIGILVRKMSENASRVSYETERMGRISVQENATQVTITHGYDDPRHLVVVYPVVNWNTTLWPVSQNQTSITFVFSVPAPGGAILTWKASK